MNWEKSTPSLSRRSLHIQIEGRVQGVGFRAFVDLQARSMGLDGWVRNRRDGSVEAVILGPRETVDHMLVLCRSGPADARVEMLRILDESSAAEPGFTVLPTV